MPNSTATIPAEHKKPIIPERSRKRKTEEISGFDDGDRQRTLVTPTATIQVIHTKEERCIIRLKRRKIKDIEPDNIALHRSLLTPTALIQTIHTKDKRCFIRRQKRKTEAIRSDNIDHAKHSASTESTPKEHKKSTTSKLSHSQKRKTEDISSGITNQSNHVKEIRKSKSSHDQPSTSTQQEPNVEVADHPIDITELFTLPDHSLSDSDRVSTFIHEYTKEHNHRARLSSIKHEETEHFVCHITIRLKGTAEFCKGHCEIPIADMDSDIARYFRTRTKSLDNAFDIAEVSMGTAFENIFGKVRLGKVTGEDYIPDTYTCEAEFAHTAGTVAWRGEVHVTKRFVPEYKLVNWVGEQDSVPSIETVSEETVAHEERLDASCTIDFARPIKVGLDQLEASFWSLDGEECFESQETHTIANELDDEHIDLQLRVRKDEESWWHMYGSMHRELTHGRFVCLTEPFPNDESDVHFAWHLHMV